MGAIEKLTSSSSPPFLLLFFFFFCALVYHVFALVFLPSPPLPLCSLALLPFLFVPPHIALIGFVCSLTVAFFPILIRWIAPPPQANPLNKRKVV